MSMTSFVLEIEKSSYTQTEKYRIIEWENKCQAFDKIINYAKFLKQPLKLEMFVPCDEEGNVLEEPKIEEEYVDEHTTQIFAQYQYDLDKAKEKVLFEGFYIKRGSTDVDNMTTYLMHNYFGEIAFKKDWKDEWEFIEDLESLSNLNEIELTENAVKQIRL